MLYFLFPRIGYYFLILLIPLAFFILNKKKKNNLEFILDSILSFLMVILSFRYFLWILINHYLKYIILLIYALNLIYLIFNVKKPVKIEHDKKFFYFKFILTLIFLVLNLLLFYGIFPDEKPVDLSFPLKNGNYYVFYGGKFPFYNLGHLRKNNRNNYSMDVVKMNEYGFAAKKLYSKKFTDHFIYNEFIYSPCNGKVNKIVNIKKDGPDKKTRGIIPNNIIIIQYKDYDVCMAHLIKDSFLVKEGDIVKTGDKIGLSGSAGCEMPHLHIQVFKKNRSVPFTFSNKFYYDNCVIKN